MVGAVAGQLDNAGLAAWGGQGHQPGPGRQCICRQADASAARFGSPPACLQALAARGDALNRGAQHWGPSVGGLEVLVEGHGVVVGVQGGHDARLLVVAHL